MRNVILHHLGDRGDDRGSSFTLRSDSLAWLGTVRDTHVAWIKPGKIRGDHFHLRRREVLVVVHSADWTLFWDEGEGMPVQSICVRGRGTSTVEIPVECSHAIRNDANVDLLIIGLSSEAYDPDESVRRMVSGVSV